MFHGYGKWRHKHVPVPPGGTLKGKGTVTSLLKGLGRLLPFGALAGKGSGTGTATGFDPGGFNVTANQVSPVSSAVTLTASGMSTTNLTSIQFLLNTYVLEAAVTSAPYQIVWSSPLAQNTPSGVHTLSAVATYSNGSQVLSGPLSLAVNNPVAFGATYYVNGTSGSDTANGTIAAPWRTITHANAIAVSGDTIYLQGTFSGQTIGLNGNSGTAARPITWALWPGQTVSIGPNPGPGTNIDFGGRSYTILDGLFLHDGTPNAAVIMGGSHHIAIRNCTTVQQRFGLVTARDCVIENCLLQDYGDDASNGGDTVWIANGSHRNKILHNVLSRGGHSCIYLGGDVSTDTDCTLNVVAHNDISNPWAMTMDLSWKARTSLVEYNIFRDAATNSVNQYPRYGLTMQASNNTIRYNVIYGNTDGGIQMQGYIFGGGIIQDTVGCAIYGNTFFNNGFGNSHRVAGPSTNSVTGPGISMTIQNERFVNNNLIVNNIFYKNVGFHPLHDGPAADFPFQFWTDFYQESLNGPSWWGFNSIGTNQIRNNILMRTPTSAGEVMTYIVAPAGNNNEIRTMAQFQTFATVSGNLEVNPNFLSEVVGDPNFLRLPANSPAVNAGIAVTDPNAYYHATQRPFLGTAPDLGAYETA